MYSKDRRGPLQIGDQIIDFKAIKAEGGIQRISLGDKTFTVRASSNEILIHDGRFPEFAEQCFHARVYLDPETRERVATWDIFTKSTVTGRYLEGFPRGRHLVQQAVEFLGIEPGKVDSIRGTWWNVPGSDNYAAFEEGLAKQGLTPSLIDSLSDQASVRQALLTAARNASSVRQIPPGFELHDISGIRMSDNSRSMQTAVVAVFRPATAR